MAVKELQTNTIWKDDTEIPNIALRFLEQMNPNVMVGERTYTVKAGYDIRIMKKDERDERDDPALIGRRIIPVISSISTSTARINVTIVDKCESAAQITDSFDIDAAMVGWDVTMISTLADIKFVMPDKLKRDLLTKSPEVRVCAVERIPPSCVRRVTCA